VVPYDLRTGQDVRDAAQVAAAMGGCDGVVHLAAMSRVAWGQTDPDGCVATNVGGTRNVLRGAAAGARSPFVLFASSREVYGEPAVHPVSEDAPLQPLNVYARTKVQGEALVRDARGCGLSTAAVRLSNVFGDPDDHADRVVPAFLRAARSGGTLRVEGPDRSFDFTWLHDVVDGLMAIVDQLATGERNLPALHLVSGQETSLGALAELAMAAAGGGRAETAPGRTYDVCRFVGDPGRAEAVLGWRATTPLSVGISRLAAAMERSEVLH